ncbi:CLUMA_CG019380, isoform A [Clunio marinus]|uniref:CLUMA_CG019380, isoform A n=1 Tax=Clunio marinus TaxID=568069 RepID=A0A1J1J0K6_9DIPT|nr:CLUMA_CG019380, isoform A [Clunio marinus]
MSSLKKASRTKPLSLSQDDYIYPRGSRTRKNLMSEKIEETQAFLKYLDDNIVGKGVLFFGPYGRRKGE